MTKPWWRTTRLQCCVRLRAAANQPVDVAILSGFRIVFGLVLFVGLLRFLATGWIAPMYTEPTFRFAYPGFAWVTPLSLTGMYVLYTLLALLGLAIALGLASRWASVAFALGFAYTQLLDVTNYLNHHYLVVLLCGLFAVMPRAVHIHWGVRQLATAANVRVAAPTVPSWALWLFRFQIGVVYFYAGLAKAKGDWLWDAQPLSIWLSARTDTPLIGPSLDEPWVAYAMSWAGFFYDTTIVGWLLWSRTRRWAYAAVCVFHTVTGYFFNIGIFPFIMSAAALVFFSPASWRRVGDAVRGVLQRKFWGQRDAARAAGSAGRWAAFNVPPAAGVGVTTLVPVDTEVTSRRCWRRRLAECFVSSYVLIQLALPLRHFIYPGNVLWNEDGMRFAWHVMLREKHGSVTFVMQTVDGRRLLVPPRKYLTARQEREMCSQPDLILQLAHHIGRDLKARGYAVAAVYADNVVSLNGRAPVPMIDSSIDLLAVRDWGRRWWVTPEPRVRAFRKK